MNNHRAMHFWGGIPLIVGFLSSLLVDPTPWPAVACCYVVSACFFQRAYMLRDRGRP